MSLHKEKHTISVSGGSGSSQTYHPQRGQLWQIYISPATETTTWDMEIRELKSGDEILGWESQTGSINSTSGLEVPVQGHYTLHILNSDADESFEFRIVVKEPVYASS